MWQKVSFSILALLVLGVAAAQAQEVEWIRAAYWDARYPVAWSGGGEGMRDALAVAGYETLDADQLKTWMEARIADKAYSVVVFCRDIAPDTVVENNDANCTLRRYLDAGGKIVFYADIPFYNQGHADGSTTTWGQAGAGGILGLANSISWDTNNQVHLTDDGRTWGLTKSWGSQRPYNSSDVDVVLATDNAGNAAAWVKHYVVGDRFRGFIRLRDTGGMPEVADVIRVAEYVGAKASQPTPADGATGVVQPLLTWEAGSFAFWHDLYFGTDPEPPLIGRQMWNMYFHPTPLVPGATYYWRVDEVSPDGVTLYEGDLWSFTAVPVKACAPVPADGAQYQDVDVDLAWTAGQKAVSQDVYFGTSGDDVANGDASVFQGNQNILTFELDSLEIGTTYYWRVDEINDAGDTIVGDVWSFATLPVIPVSDPNLVAWWTLDENEGTNVLDWSGHDNHGSLRGDPQWASGYDGDALDFDGSGDYVDFGSPQDWPAGTAPRSMCVWAKTDSIDAGWRWAIAYGTPNTAQAMFIGINGTDLYGGGYADDVFQPGFWDLDVWHHICLTYDGVTARLYADGIQVAAASKSWDLVLNRAHIGRQVNDAAEFWDGMIDDARLYDVALTPEQIQQVMRGNTTRAWAPQPANDYITDIRSATPLTWSAGDKASQHDVYLGTDEAAVKTADASDATGIYRTRQSGTSYTPAETLEWGQTYFWRVDEVNNDQTLATGRLWCFTVADYLIVDDFESYTNESPNRLFQGWVDGLGYSQDEYFPNGNLGNGTGAAVGHDIWSPGSAYLDGTIAERSDVHSGDQAMPLYYDNAAAPYRSEAERTWQTPQDLTLGGVSDLSLWFKGKPVDFMETAPGEVTMSGAGGDIYMQIDEFRFAYKELVGDGSITAKIDRLDNTGTWARAGVMVRGGLDAVVPQAHMVVTPANRVEYAHRELANGGTVGISTVEGSTPLSHWVRITRQGDTVTGEHSADGVTWETIANGGSSQNVPMFGSVYIGLAVSSFNRGVPTVAEFSEVTTTGAVSGPWQVKAIAGDHPSNDRADLYVAVEDSAGRVATAIYPDGAIVNDWTQWTLPLSDLTDAGVNVTAVKKVSIGVGDPSAASADGSGMILVDDVQVIKPPAEDPTGDDAEGF
ncbi:MAG: LamG domain-containing protein [Sedimentisphaerales bacterium]|nr:LamG domain-containing protein [Sedimentisphaerales bacterium]